MRTPLIIALSATAVLAASWAGGCFVAGFEQVPGEGGAAPATSTSSSGGSGGSGGASGCVHKLWPPQPTESSPGPDDVDVVVVARSLDFGEADISMGALVGLDLDNSCTCQGDPPGCVAPSFAPDDFCDGPGGVDNAVGEFFNFLGQFDDNFTSAYYTERAEEGRSTILVRVRDYNGGANDDQVTLSIHPSPGRDVDPCGGPTQPNWDGNDSWPVSSVSLEPPGSGGVGGGGGGAGGAGGGGGAGGAPPPTCGNNGFDPDAPRYFDDSAYVTDHVVVGNLPALALQIASDNESVPIALTAGFVVGTLVEQSNGWAMVDGVIVGRWKMEDFFKMVGSITSQGNPVCTDTTEYGFIKNAVCDYADIASTLGGPTTPCDAMSLALGFQGEPAVFGSVVPQIPVQPLCPPQTDPQFDSCENMN